MKIATPVARAVTCPICENAFNLHVWKGEYTLHDKHCKYTIKFRNPRLVDHVEELIAARCQEEIYECPVCNHTYQMREVEGGFEVIDSKCRLSFQISSDSPLVT